MKQPVKFLPYLKSTGWGGSGIADFKGISVNCSNIGESWEISSVPGMESIVAEGEQAGMTLPELVALHKDSILGKSLYDISGTEFPISVKLVDVSGGMLVRERIVPDGKVAHTATSGYIIRADGGAQLHVCGDSHSVTDMHAGEMVSFPDSGKYVMDSGVFYIEIENRWPVNFCLEHEIVESENIYVNDENLFRVLICLSGDGRVVINGISTYIRRGETLLIPACVGGYTVSGHLNVLTVIPRLSPSAGSQAQSAIESALTQSVSM